MNSTRELSSSAGTNTLSAFIPGLATTETKPVNGNHGNSNNEQVKQQNGKKSVSVSSEVS